MEALAKNDGGETPLYQASVHGIIPIVKLLLNNGAKATYGRNNSSLHVAAEFGDIELIEALVSHNADVDEKGSHSLTPLGLAVEEGQCASVRKLLECGAKTDFPGLQSPIHIAADNDHLEIVKELLKHNAKIDITDEQGTTALHVAAMNGKITDFFVFRKLDMKSLPIL